MVPAHLPPKIIGRYRSTRGAGRGLSLVLSSPCDHISVVLFPQVVWVLFPPSHTARHAAFSEFFIWLEDLSRGFFFVFYWNSNLDRGGKHGIPRNCITVQLKDCLAFDCNAQPLTVQGKLWCSNVQKFSIFLHNSWLYWTGKRNFLQDCLHQ